MWFLLLQIFILMLLAAALGAALMWWWLSRRYETMEMSRERLLEQTNRLGNLATRDDVVKQVDVMLAALKGQKPVDLEPVEQKVETVRQAVADIRLPETDFSPVNDRIAALERRLAAFSLDPVLTRVDTGNAAVDQRLARLEAGLRDIRIPEVNLGPVHAGLASLGLSVNALEPKLGDIAARLESARRNDMDIIASRFTAVSGALSNLRIPDVAPLQQRLNELQVAIANIRMPDVAPMQQRLNELQVAVANIRVPDIAPIQSRLTEVQSAISNIPQPNLQPLQASLSDLETFVVALDKPPQDLTPVFNRLASLDAALATVLSDVREAAALKPVERRLASLEEAIGTMPGPDFTPVLTTIRSIDSRNDLVAVENRLTALEYGLAALHHMMRSRPDAPREAAAEARVAPPLQVVRETVQVAAPARPEREADPINAFRRADDQANLLTEPAFGQPDDLERIDGVGPMLRALLHDLGIYYFWQVAEWSNAEIDWVESKLAHFRGRIRRDDWVTQSRNFAAAPGAGKRPMQQALRKPL